MSSSPPAPNPAQLEQALDTHEAIGRSMDRQPTWQDFVDEGVIDHVPEPDENGEQVAKAMTPEQSLRAYEMTLESEYVIADHAEKLTAEKPRVTIKDQFGKPKSVTEQNAEAADRKMHAIRTGHLTAQCKPCGRTIEMPERILRYGLKKARCRVCGRPLSFFASMSRA
jgi:hypothetical protein